MDPPAAPVSLSRQVRKVRSPGGIEAWLFEDPSRASLSMSFGFRGGALLDPARKSGGTTMMVSLLTEGSGSLDVGAFGRALGDHAIQLSFGVRRDAVTGHLRTLSRSADRAFELLALALRAPRFMPDALARVRGRMLARDRHAASDPASVAFRALLAHGFAGQGYAHPVEGDLAGIEALDGDTIADLHRRAITRRSLVVTVVGAIDPRKLETVLDAVFGDLPEGVAFDPSATALAGLGEQVVSRLSVPQSTLYVGRPGIRREDPDFIAAHVVNHCLGGGTVTSRLMREVRVKRGLCYGIRTWIEADAVACTFMGSTSVANAKVRETLSIMADEICRFAIEGISADELEKARSYLIGIYGQNFDTSVSIANLLLSLRLEGREPTWLDERGGRIAAVTQEDAARAVARLLGDGRMLTVIAGEPAEA